MKKMKYIEPQMAVEPVSTDASIMLLGSGSGPQPVQHAPMRQDPDLNIS